MQESSHFGLADPPCRCQFAVRGLVGHRAELFEENLFHSSETPTMNSFSEAIA